MEPVVWEFCWHLERKFTSAYSLGNLVPMCQKAYLRSFIKRDRASPRFQFTRAWSITRQRLHGSKGQKKARCKCCDTQERAF